jgi:hypothetical protein
MGTNLKCEGDVEGAVDMMDREKGGIVTIVGDELMILLDGCTREALTKIQLLVCDVTTSGEKKVN